MKNRYKFSMLRKDKIENKEDSLVKKASEESCWESATLSVLSEPEDKSDETTTEKPAD